MTDFDTVAEIAQLLLLEFDWRVDAGFAPREDCQTGFVAPAIANDKPNRWKRGCRYAISDG